MTSDKAACGSRALEQLRALAEQSPWDHQGRQNIPMSVAELNAGMYKKIYQGTLGITFGKQISVWKGLCMQRVKLKWNGFLSRERKKYQLPNMGL